jgi:predicted NAD/FAD-dependent oxidoreductase
LGAARLLNISGHEVVVFEKADHVGGRCTSEKIDNFLFDTGATSVAPRNMLLAQVMLHELDTSDLVKVSKPIYTHTALRVQPGDPSHMKTDRFTYLLGNERLPKLLAANLDVRLGTEIEGVEKSADKYKIANEEFEAVIVATPLPITAKLLERSGEQRSIGHVFYRPCLTVLLGYDKEIPPINYHAVVDPEQRHPLTWLSVESVKCPGRAPEGETAFVAQLSPQFTRMHYESSNGFIIESTVEYVERLYGQAWSRPAVMEVRRWQYSQPENLALFGSVNHPSARLLIASDGLLGGRVEFAYEAGARTAKLLTNEE